MSIRSLAASLGVAPMSLYRHVRDKDDLLDEVVDRLLAGAWRPAAAEDDWQAWMTEAASRLRDFLVSQPAALHVYLSHPVVSPAAIERMTAMMGVLRRTGIDEETARSAYGALHTYTIGFAALEASRPAGQHPTRGTPAGSPGSSPPTPPPGSSSTACTTCSKESAAAPRQPGKAARDQGRRPWRPRRGGWPAARCGGAGKDGSGHRGAGPAGSCRQARPGHWRGCEPGRGGLFLLALRGGGGGRATARWRSGT